MERFPDLSDLEVVRDDAAGQVYRAYQGRFDRLVAVKVLATPLASDESVLRFERQCRLVERLGAHPHIVTVYATGLTDDGRPFVVTEYLAGGSLAGRLRGSGPLPVPEVLQIGVKIAGALASAHEQGALHGDIRPGCILVSASREPVLSGFGLSALAADPTSGVPLPAHAAPEVVDSGWGDGASDLYALGSTLLTLLTGRPPEAALADCLDRAGPAAGNLPHLVPPGADGAPLPDRLVLVLAGLTAHDPGERPVDARAAAAALREVQKDLGLPATIPLVARLVDADLYGDGVGQDAVDHPLITLLINGSPEPEPTRAPAGAGSALVGPVAPGLVARTAGDVRPAAPDDRPRRVALMLLAAGSAALVAAAVVVGVLVAVVAAPDTAKQGTNNADVRRPAESIPAIGDTGRQAGPGDGANGFTVTGAGEASAFPTASSVPPLPDPSAAGTVASGGGPGSPATVAGNPPGGTPTLAGGGPASPDMSATSVPPAAALPPPPPTDPTAPGAPGISTPPSVPAPPPTTPAVPQPPVTTTVVPPPPTSTGVATPPPAPATLPGGGSVPPGDVTGAPAAGPTG